MRGTTSSSALSHESTLTVSDNTFRCFGRFPSFPILQHISGRPLREVFRRIFPLPCTNRQLSGGKGTAYLFPSMCYMKLTGILTKEAGFVKYFIESDFPFPEFWTGKVETAVV